MHSPGRVIGRAYAPVEQIRAAKRLQKYTTRNPEINTLLQQTRSDRSSKGAESTGAEAIRLDNRSEYTARDRLIDRE